MENLPTIKDQSDLSISFDDERKELVSNEKIFGLYDEILSDIKNSNNEIDSYLSMFFDMIANSADTAASTKEACVNLLKMKVDLTDKKTKIGEYFMKMKIKEMDQNPRNVTTNLINNQTNNINRRDLLNQWKKDKELNNSSD